MGYPVSGSSSRLGYVLTVSSVVAALCSGVAGAQTSDVALEEVIVSAERRETDLQKTPISIVAIGSEKIADIGANDLRELAQFVPNLNVTPAQFYGNAAPKINIRGIGAGAGFGIAEDRAVGLYVDGMFFPRILGALLGTTDIERVEVLRGPQGTLFGRNTTGGAVSYHTVKPSLAGFSGYVDAKAGSLNERSLSAMVNVPLSGSWAMRAQAANLSRDGYVKRGKTDMGGVDDQVARLAFRGTPNDDLTIDAAFSYTKARSNGEPQVVSSFKVNESGRLASYFGALSLQLEQVPASQGGGRLVADDPRILVGKFRAANLCGLDDKNPLTMSGKGGLCDTYRDNHLTSASVKVAYDISDNLQFSALTGLLDGATDSRTDGMWSGSYARDFSQSFQSFQHEMQVTWSSPKWQAVGGLIYFTDNANEREYTTESWLSTYTDPTWRARVLTGANRERRYETYVGNTKSAALFGQATYSFTDKIEATVGLRRTQDSKNAEIRLIPTPDDARNRFGAGKHNWGATDYRVSLNFKPTDDIMLYASRSKAYKAGIFNDSAIELGPVKPTPEIMPVTFIDPEELISHEIGLRSEWFSHRLRLNLSLYDQEWTNRQNQRGITDPASNIIVIITENQPDVSSRGVEMDFIVAATDSLTVSGALGTIDAKQKGNPGFIFDGVPDLTWQLGLEHRLALPWGGAIRSSLNYAWREATYTSNTDATSATGPVSVDFNPSYGLLNGRFTYTPDSGTWSAALYVQNLLDKYYSYSRFGSTTGFYMGTNNGSSIRTIVPGMPRTVGLQLRYNF